jgi:hypothetical protein
LKEKVFELMDNNSFNVTKLDWTNCGCILQFEADVELSKETFYEIKRDDCAWGVTNYMIEKK